MVVFTKGKPESSSYRKFKIKGGNTPDDFSMMNELLSRRLSNESLGPMPDLIVVDGGKGQLAVANRILSEKSYKEIDVISIAKERKRPDKALTDRIYITGRKNPLALKKNSPILFLIGRVRDEAHRFALTYHRKLRSRLKK